MTRLGVFALAVCSVWGATALSINGSDLDLEHEVGIDTYRLPKLTTTIPYLGKHKATRTIHPCRTGPVIVVIQTPLEVAHCGLQTTTVSQPASTTETESVSSTTETGAPVTTGTESSSTSTTGPETSTLTNTVTTSQSTETETTAMETLTGTGTTETETSAAETLTESQITETLTEISLTKTPTEISTTETLTATSTMETLTDVTTIESSTEPKTTEMDTSTVETLTESKTTETLTEISTGETLTATSTVETLTDTKITETLTESKTTEAETKTTATPTSSKCPEPTLGGPCRVRYGCLPEGLDIAYYSNPFGGYSRQGDLPSSYYITQNLRSLATSTTNETYFPQDTPPDEASFPRVYPRADLPGAWYAAGWTRATNGGLTVDANNFTLVYAGFYRAPESGVFKLCTTADNENDVFFGHGVAFDCVTGKADPGARPVIVSTGGNYVNGINCTDVSLAEGEYYPLRSVMGDWQGPSAFNLTIKRPSEPFEERKNVFDGLVYPHACGDY